MGNAEKRLGKKEKTIMLLEIEGMKAEMIQLRKQLSTMKIGKKRVLPLSQNMINMIIKFQFMKL